MRYKVLLCVITLLTLLTEPAIAQGSEDWINKGVFKRYGPTEVGDFHQKGKHQVQILDDPTSLPQPYRSAPTHEQPQPVPSSEQPTATNRRTCSGGPSYLNVTTISRRLKNLIVNHLDRCLYSKDSRVFERENRSDRESWPIYFDSTTSAERTKFTVAYWSWLLNRTNSKGQVMLPGYQTRLTWAAEWWRANQSEKHRTISKELLGSALIASSTRTLFDVSNGILLPESLSMFIELKNLRFSEAYLLVHKKPSPHVSQDPPRVMNYFKTPALEFPLASP